MKWLTIGSFEVYADKDIGKVIASIQVGLPSSPLQPLDVVVYGKSIGKYISLEKAKCAAEIALGVSLAQHDTILRSLLNSFQRKRDE